MSISSAMYTGLTGLSANGEAMAVVGDNIANLSTTGFKYSQVNFEDLMAETIGTGSGPGQVGRGCQIASVNPVFSQGSMATSANDTDVAITGTGFFILQDSTGKNYYTRDGSFNLDKAGNLVSSNGYQVMGKAIDPATGTATGTDVPIVLTQNQAAPKATNAIDMVMNLNSATTTGDNYSSSITLYDTKGTAHSLTMTYTKQDGLPEESTVTCGAGSTAGLNNTYWTVSSPAGTSTTSTTGYYVWYNVDSGGTDPKGTDPALANMTGIEVDVSSTDDATAVATKTAAALAAKSDFSKSTSTGAVVTVVNTNNGSAAAAAAGTTPAGWGTFAEAQAGLADWGISGTMDGSTDITNLIYNYGTTNPAAGLSFDTNGNLISAPHYSIDLSGFNISSTSSTYTTFNIGQTGGGSTTQYASSSVTNYASQDGYGTGYLQQISISTDGIITGHYSNGQIIPQYQFDLARFTSPIKLHREGSNMYSETQDSGVPLTGAPQSSGMGSINANSLEQSNVDLGNEFVHMILYQRAFQANSRIITTSDAMLQEVLNLKQ